MAHERRRAALAALCVFAVALAATLFPASGFGSQPAGVGVGGDGPDAPPGDGGGPDPDPKTTADADPPTATTADSDDGGPPDGDGTTETTTTAATTTTAVAGDPGTGGDLLGAVVATLLGLVALLAVVGFWTGALSVAGTAGPLPFTLVVAGTPVGELVGSVPTRTMAIVVSFAGAVPRLLDDAADLTGAAGRSLASILGAAGRGTVDALGVAARGLGATAAALPRALAGLGAGASLFASLGNVSVPSLGGRSGGDDDAGGDGARPGEEPEERRPPTVEEAWRAMVETLPVRNRRARTPRELARTALDRGYPDEAVRQLTDAFEEVRYGGLPRDDRTEAARAALETLRKHWGDRR